LVYLDGKIVGDDHRGSMLNEDRRHEVGLKLQPGVQRRG
jgi:hypothetical protein